VISVDLKPKRGKLMRRQGRLDLVSVGGGAKMVKVQRAGIVGRMETSIGGMENVLRIRVTERASNSQAKSRRGTPEKGGFQVTGKVRTRAKKLRSEGKKSEY